MARNKVKDWTTEITELDDWTKLIHTDKLVVAEIYSAWFGFCESYTPVIDKIMSSFDETQQKNITWTRLNVAQLEKENNHNPLEMLDKWASYESPKPLYVFIQDQKVLATVTEANGGKMKSTLTSCVNGEDVPKTPTPEPVSEAQQASPTEETEAEAKEEEIEADAQKEDDKEENQEKGNEEEENQNEENPVEEETEINQEEKVEPAVEE